MTAAHLNPSGFQTVFPSDFVTYAQNGEDVLLWRALKNVRQGCYIDVGAEDPVVDSVTKAFYERGWRGINIEPVPHWHERLAQDRPHDINLRIAVADTPGELRLFEVEDTGLSTSDPEFAHRHEAGGHTLRERVVECTTLDQVCADHAVETVHFLKIDCEGAEELVLKGMSFSSVRPWIVLVEATEPNSTKPTWEHWEHLLTGRKYQFVFFDGLNRYYVAEEHQDLAAAFDAPVNVFDNAHKASELTAKQQIGQLQQELEALKGAAANAALRAELSAAIAEREALRRQFDMVTRERDAAREQGRIEGESLRSRIGVLQAERDEVRMRAGVEHEALQCQIDVAAAERDALMERELWLQREIERYREESLRLAESRATLLSSRSWRLTAPLRGLGNAYRWTYRGSRRALYRALRPFAHLARPALRWASKNRVARRLAIGALGRQSRATGHLRLFLFGAGTALPATRDLQSPAALLAERGMQAGDLQPSMIGSGSRDPSEVCEQYAKWNVDVEMERVRAELAARCAPKPPAPPIPDVAARPGSRHALNNEEMLARVRAEVARRRAGAHGA